MEKLDEAAAVRLLQALEQEIAAHGPLRIGKFSGVFEAVKQA